MAWQAASWPPRWSGAASATTGARTSAGPPRKGDGRAWLSERDRGGRGPLLMRFTGCIIVVPSTVQRLYPISLGIRRAVPQVASGCAAGRGFALASLEYRVEPSRTAGASVTRKKRWYHTGSYPESEKCTGRNKSNSGAPKDLGCVAVRTCNRRAHRALAKRCHERQCEPAKFHGKGEVHVRFHFGIAGEHRADEQVADSGGDEPGEESNNDCANGFEHVTLAMKRNADTIESAGWLVRRSA